MAFKGVFPIGKQYYTVNKLVMLKNHVVFYFCNLEIKILVINPLQPGVAFLYPPKTSENL